ncbi:MAG: formylglycine-generating enzyme family protein [Nitrospira sp.]|nr:formylglycine-generating enzyme family protein [Nitrospira sp.]
MLFSYDRTGFPLIPLYRAGVEVHWLPVTKVQLECFLAETGRLGNDWYEEVLKLNPQVSYSEFTGDHREQLFVTGILPEEALAFARWMEDRFDLPTVEEWRTIYEELALGLDPLYNPVNLPSECQG